MPAILEPSIAKPLDQRLSRAAGRIRLSDVLTGLLAIVVLTLGYAVTMILLDRSLQLPEIVRQLGFVAWLTSVGFVAYRYILRPFTQRINPLYVAKRVESTIPDAKNVVTNYVDLQDRDLPESVRTAVAKQASSEVTDSDVQKAGESRVMVGLGLAAAALAVLLAVFFLAFSPAQFVSLVNRTFRPFYAAPIVSKTRIEIVLPADPNATITAGQPLVFQVMLDGRLPKADGEERTRILLRHNPDDANFETVNFEPGATNREFQIRVPDYLVQNGFWYKIAAGDGETSEYRVTVRPRLLVTGVSVTYDYPKYLRMPTETVDRPHIEAYRGTNVTITAKANRAVTSGRLVFDGKPDAIAGKVNSESAEQVKFSFTITESGIYRLYLSTKDGDSTIDPPAYPIKVVVDNPPTVTIEKPSEEMVEVPLNGTITFDAIANDDIGVAKLTTQLQIAGDKPVSLPGKEYRVKLKRETDGSYPTRVEMKESIALPELKTEFKEGDILEYWVEAEDNCDVSAAQVGKSTIKRVKLVAIPKEPEKQQEQKDANQQRKGQEQKHDAQQKEKFEGEKRQPPSGQQNPNDPGEKSNDTTKPMGNEGGDPSQEKPMGSDPKDPNQKSGQQGNDPNQKPNPPMGNDPKDPNQKSGQGNDPNQQPVGNYSNQKSGQQGNDPNQKPNPPMGSDPKDPNQKSGQGNDPNQKPMGNDPKDPNQKSNGSQAGSDNSIDPQQRDKLEKKAEQISKELNKPEAGNGGSSNGSKEMTQEQKQQMQDAIKDLNSNDPSKKAAAEQKLDQMMGKENREKAQQEAEQLKNDLKSNDPATRDAAQKKVEKMAEQMKKQQKQHGGEGQSGEMTPDQKQKFEQAAKDMSSNDPAKKAAGEKAMDDMIGQGNREKAQKEADQIKNDLQSDDPKTRQDAKEKLEKMAEQVKQQGGAQGGQGEPKPLTPDEKKELSKAGDRMKSNDPKEKANAEKTIDKATGQDQRNADQKNADQAKDDLKNGSEQAKADAKKNLEKMTNQQAGNGQPKPGEGMSEKEKQEIANAAKDLNSTDPEKRAAAERTLDDKMGKANREQAQKDAEQLKKDLQSSDPATRDAAQKKVEQIAKEMQKQAGAGQPQPDQSAQKPDPAAKPKTPEEMKAIRDAAKSANSDNADEKKAAQETLDKELGPDGREKAEKLSQDLKSNNPQTRKEAENKLNELANKNGEPSRKPTAEEIRKEQERLAEKAKDLTSKDDAKRKQAEKDLDQAMGQENREKMQQAMNDMQSGDPKRQEEGQKKLDEMMKDAQAKAGQFNKDWKPGGSGGGEKGGKPLEDNPLDRLKTHELQLKSFKDNQTNKELLAKLGYNQAEYDEFVKGFEKLVESERKQIAVKPKTGSTEAPKSLNANRGGEKLGSRNAEGAGPTGSSAGNAAPGYSDATRKFAEEAAKKGNR